MTIILDRVQIQDGPMSGFNIRMTAWHQVAARTIGHGNMGQGVRDALEFKMRAVDNANKAMKDAERRYKERRTTKRRD